MPDVAAKVPAIVPSGLPNRLPAMPEIIAQIIATKSPEQALYTYFTGTHIERRDVLNTWSRRTDIRLRMRHWSPEIASAYESWIYPVLASRPRIVAPDGDESLKAKAEEIQRDLRTGTGYRDVLKATLEIPWHGCGVTELTGKNGLGNPAMGEPLIRGGAMVPFGNVKFDARGVARILTDADAVEGVDTSLPEHRWRFITGMWGKPAGFDPYGHGLAERVYWLWHFKTFARKHWAQGIEKYGVPTLIAMLLAGDWETHRDTWIEIMKDYQAFSGLAIPKESVESVQLLNAETRTFEGHKLFDEALAADIAKAILGQTLTTDSGKVGSLALGKVHKDVLTDRQWALVAWAQDLLTDTLVRYLSEYRYGADLGLRLEIELDDAADVDAGLKRLQAARESGMDIMKSEGYASIGYSVPPEDTPEEDLIPFGAQKAEADAREQEMAEKELDLKAQAKPAEKEGFAEPTSRQRSEARRLAEFDALGAAGVAAAARDLTDLLADRLPSRARKRRDDA